MDRVQLLAQAYSQAPWRRQIQIIGAFLLALVTVWVIAAIYLDVTARAATIGREIQDMQVRSGGVLRIDVQKDYEPTSIEELEQYNASLQLRLANLTSDANMAERAYDMGFRPAEPGGIVYIVVPDYVPQQPVTLAPPPGPIANNTPIITSAYKESLVDWIKDQLFQASEILKGSQP